MSMGFTESLRWQRTGPDRQINPVSSGFGSGEPVAGFGIQILIEWDKSFWIRGMAGPVRAIIMIVRHRLCGMNNP